MQSGHYRALWKLTGFIIFLSLIARCPIQDRPALTVFPGQQILYQRALTIQAINWFPDLYPGNQVILT